MVLINNKDRLLGDDLKEQLGKNVHVQIAGSFFSMYAFEALKEELQQIDELQFIFTSPTFTSSTNVTDKIKKEHREFYIPQLKRENSIYGTEFEIRLKNKLTQKAIARECADWIRNKVAFKSIVTDNTMPTFITLRDETGKEIVYSPIDGFTSSDLGYERGKICLLLFKRWIIQIIQQPVSTLICLIRSGRMQSNYRMLRRRLSIT